MIFYKVYPYAPGATLISVLGSLGALGAAAGAFVLFSAGSSILTKYVLAIVLLIIAVLCYIFVGNVFPNKLAEKQTQKNITTKANYAYSYCRQHPEEYEKIAAVNQAFAEKYELNEKGKVVKRK